MEEDIKTIQEKLKIIESLCTDDCINKSTVIQPLIYAIENLIAKYKELEKKNKILEEKIIRIRNITSPLIVWYDLGTKCYNLKGCSKQEVYKAFSDIRSEVKGEYIFLDDKKFLQELLED